MGLGLRGFGRVAERVRALRLPARAAGGAMLGSGFDEAQRLVEPLVDAGRYLLSARPAR